LENYRVVDPDIQLTDIQSGETIVLIDNLRASSTIVTALAMGIQTVIPLTDDKKVFELKDDQVLTSGESGGVKLNGYDIGNSPVEIETVCKKSQYKTLLIKTTNLVPLLLSFPHAVICSSLNLNAAAKYLKNKKVCIIPAGGNYGCAEDLGVAFALGYKMTHPEFMEGRVSCFTRESAAAKHLAEIGYQGDVDYISRTSIFDIVPVFDGKKIVRANEDR
jgi:2-phosphosulfolactate phosphatase